MPDTHDKGNGCKYWFDSNCTNCAMEKWYLTSLINSNFVCSIHTSATNFGREAHMDERLIVNQRVVCSNRALSAKKVL